MNKSIKFLQKIKSMLISNKKSDNTNNCFYLSISNELNQVLTELTEDQNFILGIHKSGMANPEEIIKEGLKLTGHLSSGVLDKEVCLEHNINFYNMNNFRLTSDIMAASVYKTYGTNKGNAIVIRIPILDIERMDKLLKSEARILKPEYIVGYIPVTNDEANRLITVGDIVYARNKIKQR